MKVGYYTTKVETGSFSGSKHVILCIMEDRAVLGTTELLDDLGKITGLAGSGVFLAVAAVPEISMPVLTMSEESFNGAECYDCTSVYSLIKNQLIKVQSDELSQQVTNALKTKLLQFFNGDMQFTSAIIASCICQYIWEKTEKPGSAIQADLGMYDTDLLSETQNLLSSVNAGFLSSFTPEMMADNVTLKQDSCTDRLFICLPTREQLLETDSDGSPIDIYKFIPMRDAVCVPYMNPVDETPDYEQAIRGNGNLLVSQPSRLRAITGDKSNNGLEVQDNEIDYYNMLCAWIRNNIFEYYAAESTTLDPHSLNYLEALLAALYMWHWKHNANVPVSYNKDTDTEDGVQSAYEFGDYPGFPKSRINAVLVLHTFLKKVAAEIGWEVYPQAVIQLARWGSRKPTCLQFSQYKQVFSLGDNTIIEKMGSLADYTPNQINGKSCRLVGLILDTTKIADSKIGCRAWPMPVGITVEREYSNSEGNKISLRMHYSMIDMIREICLGHLTVDGIEYTDGTWQVADTDSTISVQEILDDIANNGDKMLQFPIFRSQGLIDLYMNLNTNYKANLETQFSLMSIKLIYSGLTTLITNNTFSSYSELSELLGPGGSGNRKAVIDYMIVRDLLKVYHQAAVMHQDGCSNSQLFTEWHNAILRSGYVNESYFYNDRTNQDKPLPGTVLENFNCVFWEDGAAHPGTSSTSRAASTGAGKGADIQRIQSFGGTQESKVPENKKEGSNASMLFMKPTKDCKCCKIMNGQKLAAVCMVTTFQAKSSKGDLKNFNRYIILSRQTVQSINLDTVQDSVDIRKIYAYICHALLCLSNNVMSTNQLCFESSTALVELRNLINHLASE